MKALDEAMTGYRPLRIFTEDSEDLRIVASAVRDCVVKAGNIRFERRTRRLSLEVNRYRWESAPTRKGRPGERVRALLAFDGVMGVRTRAISKADPELILSLLDISFIPDEEPPGGRIRLLFAGDGEILLDVEALDVSLVDSLYVWPTRNRPDHERRRR